MADGAAEWHGVSLLTIDVPDSAVVIDGIIDGSGIAGAANLSGCDMEPFAMFSDCGD